MSKIFVTDTILRDAHQCLLATRMRTEDMLPICETLDQAGYWSLEVWGGATFDACLRFLKEDPWQRLRALKKSLPNTPLQMLLRGQNLLGYRHYPDDVVNAFVALAAKNGIDVFRIFDALNDTRNCEAAIRAVKTAGKHAQGAISYTTSPVHNIEQFVAIAQTYEALGCDSIAIKDMAGLLTPTNTALLCQALTKKISVPLHLHTHDSAGLALPCLFTAIEHGCSHVDTAISALAFGASHACTESFVVGLNPQRFQTDLNLHNLQKIGDYFREVRKKYHQFESAATAVDPRVHIYQIPGGMISNLYNQLKEQNALSQLNAVYQEIYAVRKELGYPPLVTPTSQIVGTQAVMNVLTGKRYESITNEVKLYLQGKYGKAPGTVDPTIRRQAIGDADIIRERPADLLAPELANLTQAIGALAHSEEDVLSYAMFPDVGKVFLQERAENRLKPEPLSPPKNTEQETRGTAPREFKITLHGEVYDIRYTGSGHENVSPRPFYLTVDGVPEEVFLDVLDEDNPIKIKKQQNNKRPLATTPGHVTTSVPSTIIDILVKPGETVKAGKPILITEAMKMETEIQAPISGTIEEIYVRNGDHVNPDEALILIRSACATTG